jgi:hypothetical protein
LTAAATGAAMFGQPVAHAAERQAMGLAQRQMALATPVASPYVVTLGASTRLGLTNFTGGGVVADVAVAGLTGVPNKQLILPPHYEPIGLPVFLGQLDKFLFDLIRGAWQNTPQQVSGSISRLDVAANEVNRRTFQDALLERVKFPAMSIASRDAGRLTVELSPTKTRFVAGTQQPVQQAQTNGATWLLSNFTLKLGTLDPRPVLAIDAFAVETLAGKPPVFPNLVVTLDEPTAAGWQAWFDSFLAGRTGAGNELSGTITLSDTNGVPLMSISLKGVGMCRLDPIPSSTFDVRPRLEAELYVEQMDIVPGA